MLLVVHDVSFKLINTVNEKLTLSLYLKDEFNQNSIEVIDLLSDVKKGFPHIRATYINKEEALENIRNQDEELVRILEKQNPLPETITLKNISLDEFEKLNTLIENKLFIFVNVGEDEKDYFWNYNAQYERIIQVTSVLSTLQIGLYAIIAVFLVSITIIVYSIIGNFIFYYKDEIYITRLVGGSKFFIYGPFSLQGAIYAAVSFFLSVLLFVFFLKNIQYLVAPSFNDSILMTNTLFLFALEWIVFVCIGAIGGFLSSRKYLK